MRPAAKRCALYTRKSSQEGLEQAFNSLDAQREACSAYVKSQAGEGWKVLTQRYDDGGISGATLERAALQRLLGDIAAGLVDVVVVYKIDRLTRSLADFAHMVELFDRHSVSFVSVTQSFNTTSSMGRLTLNVLLSFAQFEREVTAERIRDKIAASKKKGMWMGGRLPLGYDAPAGGHRALVVNEAEARIVRAIFGSYLKLDSVEQLQAWLARQGIRSKRHVTRKGKVIGDKPFSRGALFHLLRNRTYLGMIVHGKQTYAGLHEAIIDQELFDAVQDKLASSMRRKPGAGGRVRAAPLAGRIFDDQGCAMTPSFAYGRKGRLYRYYVQATKSGNASKAGPHARVLRVSATRLEAHLAQALCRLGNDRPKDPLDLIERVEVHRNKVIATLPAASLNVVPGVLNDIEHIEPDEAAPGRVRLILPLMIPGRGATARTASANAMASRPDTHMIAALRQAHAMVNRDRSGRPMIEVAPDTPYQRKIIRLAFLAPAIQCAILAGRQPQDLTLTRLIESEIPASWDAQIASFGFGGKDAPAKK